MTLSTLCMAACGESAQPLSTPNRAEATDAPKKPQEPVEARTAELDVYRSQAKHLITLLEAGAPEAEVLLAADTLTQTGIAALEPMIRQHPECEGYLRAIEAAGPTLKTLPLAEIETGYHSDGALPPMPSPECYHGKDLVVHPATVAAMATAGLKTQDARTDAKAEITEVLAHLAAVDSDHAAPVERPTP